MRKASKEVSAKPSRLDLWAWAGFCVPFILFVLHLWHKQDTRPFKEQITRTVFANWTQDGKDTIRVQVLGSCNASKLFMVEDGVGNRRIGGELIPEDIDQAGLIALNPDAAYYVLPESESEVSSLFWGMTLKELVDKYGDYAACDVAQGRFTFPQIVPVIDGERYDAGLVFAMQDGKVADAMLADAQQTSSNLYLKLPFADEILSLNWGRAHFSPYCTVIPENEGEEGQGCFGAVANFLWQAVLVVLGLAILLFFAAFCAATCGLIGLPLGYYLAYHTNIGNWTIRVLMAVFSFPLVYAATISFCDAASPVWLLVFPLMFVCGMSAAMATVTMPTIGRCPKCHSIGTLREKPVHEELVREGQFWQDGSSKRKTSRKDGEYLVIEYEVERRLVRRKVVRRTYLTTCSHCTYRKEDCREEYMDKILKTELSTRAERVKQLKQEETVYIYDESGRRIRCVRNIYSPNRLRSDEESGVWYERQPGGRYKSESGEHYEKKG